MKRKASEVPARSGDLPERRRVGSGVSTIPKSTNTYTHTHSHIRSHTHTHTYTNRHTQTYTHTHTQTHTHTHTHINLHTHILSCHLVAILISLNTPRILGRADKCRDRQPLSGCSRDTAIPPRCGCPLVASHVSLSTLHARPLRARTHTHTHTHTGCREQDLLRADDPEAYLILIQNTVVAPMPPSLPVPSRPKRGWQCATERDGEEGEASIKSLLLRVIGRALATTPSLPWVPAWKRKNLTFSSILAAGYREVMTPTSPSISTSS
jgi:hypothetical protein